MAETGKGQYSFAGRIAALFNEQLYSSPSDGERKKQKTIYNKHQNTYSALTVQKQQILQRGQGKLV